MFVALCRIVVEMDIIVERDRASMSRACLRPRLSHDVQRDSEDFRFHNFLCERIMIRRTESDDRYCQQQQTRAGFRPFHG